MEEKDYCIDTASTIGLPQAIAEIKKDSLCFDIPFTIENKKKGIIRRKENIFTKYFDTIKNIPNKSERNPKRKESAKEYIITIKDIYIIDLLKSKFRNVNANFKPIGCELDYNGRFLCKCFSLAAKFHDDDSQKKEIVQLWLDSISVNYKYPNSDDRFSFEMNIILQVSQENEEYNAHLILHIPIKDKTIDEIIFLKHLFYKKNLEVEIERKLEIKWKPCSLHDWFKEYIKNLYSVIDISQKNMPQEYFTYSLLEINDSKVKFTNQKDILYALLTSDEGWKFLPEGLSAERLQYSWSTRNHFKCYFLGTNGLLINNIESESSYKKHQTDYFQKYLQNDNNKYVDFINSKPCIAGLKTQVFMNFQKGAEKKEGIRNTMQEIEEYDGKLRNGIRQISKLEALLETVRKKINSKAFSVQEMDNLNESISKSFNISNDLGVLKDAYSQKMKELSSKYEKRTKFYTLLITIVVSLSGLAKFIPDKIASSLKDILKPFLEFFYKFFE